MPSTSAAITDPDRLRALYATGLLDSPPEEIYDRITRAAAAALDAPSAAMSLVDVDRQFFKSTVGMGGDDARRKGKRHSSGPCVNTPWQMATPLILEDARIHPIFKNHPVVRDGSVVAYLGIPLIDHDGQRHRYAVRIRHQAAAVGHRPRPDPERSRRSSPPSESSVRRPIRAADRALSVTSGSRCCSDHRANCA